MLRKSRRLTTHDVDEVLEKGRSVHISAPKGQNTLISLKFLATPGPFRVAVVAPKSLARRATERNRLRRAVYRAIDALPTPKRSGLAVFFVRGVPKDPLTPAFAAEVKVFLEKI